MSIIQAVLFDKEFFPTTRDCRDWLNETGLDYIKPALVSEYYIKYKLVEPEPYLEKGYRFKPIHIDIVEGVELVMMEKSPEPHIKYLHQDKNI